MVKKSSSREPLFSIFDPHFRIFFLKMALLKWGDCTGPQWLVGKKDWNAMTSNTDHLKASSSFCKTNCSWKACVETLWQKTHAQRITSGSNPELYDCEVKLLTSDASIYLVTKHLITSSHCTYFTRLNLKKM